jgi:hypothetical protein
MDSTLAPIAPPAQALIIAGAKQFVSPTELLRWQATQKLLIRNSLLTRGIGAAGYGIFSWLAGWRVCR